MLGTLAETDFVALADSARDSRQWDQAAKHYRKALDRKRDNPPIWVQYGHALKESGNLADAEAAYRTALIYQPDAADTHLQLGHVLKMQGNVDAARAAYLRAFAFDQTLSHAIQELGGVGWTEDQLLELGHVARPEAPPAPPVVDAVTAQNRQRLFDLVRDEFGEPPARRVIQYFSIIESLQTEAGPGASSARHDIIANLVDRIGRLSRAAADDREIEATIIVTAFEHVEYTLASVLSLLEHKCSARYEIIIGNNLSRDETKEVFEAIGGIVRCITHEVNEGFIRNCNLSARHAAGKYIVLLNNDTFILDYWLDELLAPFDRFNKVGLVGSKLLMADGTLQEAGGIVWNDGSAWNYGRGQDPRLPQFNYLKDVDYISGAAIAVPTALWEELGGLDERYMPAYCEDVDLAFQIRQNGFRTLYAPHSQIVHHEGVTHGTDTATGIKAYQVKNKAKFLEKWGATLSRENHANGENVFVARDRSRDRKHILLIDHYLPQFDRDAGSRSIFEYTKMFADAGMHVSFWPDNLHNDRPYARALQGYGVEILYGGPLVGKFPEWIRENGPRLDYALLMRAQVSERYIDDIAAHSSAKILFNGLDLNVDRLKREFALTGRSELLAEMEYCGAVETKVWKASDVLYYPTQLEVDSVLRDMPDKTVHIMPLYIYTNSALDAARRRKRANTPSTLFVGGFAHRPNADAVLWYVRHVLPLVKKEIPDIVTIVAGSNPPLEITRLASHDIVVTGSVSDATLAWLYSTVTLSVAPLRFGAGMKGKIIEALRYGVPMVTTNCGAEGFVGCEEFLEIADTPEAFARGVIEASRDSSGVAERVHRGLAYVEREFAYDSVAAHMAVDIPELEGLKEGTGFFKKMADGNS